MYGKGNPNQERRKFMNRLSALLILLLFAAGCGGKGVPVNGTVVFVFFSPLTRGEVRFVSGSKMFSGPILKDGTFVMQGATPNSGIEPGTYEVSVVGAVEIESGGKDNMYGKSRTLIAQKFNDPQTSGLTCTVKGKASVEFKVTPP
jgi:hypothetical protein